MGLVARPPKPPRVSSPETAERVWRLLAANASRSGHVSASFDDIGAALGIEATTAGRGVRRLLNDGRLLVARKGSGPGFPTTYALLDADAP